MVATTLTKKQKNITTISRSLKVNAEKNLLLWLCDEMDKSPELKKLLTSHYKIAGYRK